MSVLDAVLVVAALLLAVGGAVAPRTARLAAPVLLPLLFAGAGFQLLFEGFVVQRVPAYLLLGVATWLLVRTPRRTLPAALLLGVLVPVATAVWALPPVPRLPPPDGAYPVGSTVLRWVDESRPEPATADPGDHRNVVVQAWYPAEFGSMPRQYLYLDGHGDLPATISGIPSVLLSRYHLIDTHAGADVPLADDRPRWPVILFSPGYGAPRAVYTGLLTELASRGFVVLAVDHPYQVAVTELADGTVAHGVPNSGTDAEMAAQLAVRTADLSFALDRIGTADSVLTGRIDTTRVAAAGHSFGGAAAASALAHDPRVIAAANIDGTLYGDLPDQRLPGPYLLIDSDPALTGHSAAYVDGNRKLLGGVQGGGHHYTIGRTDHLGFTDAPLFLAPPVRTLAARWFGGERSAVETRRATADLLAAVLGPPLGERPADVAAVASRYPDITGGPV
ncbi:alpha/beta hydrolase family protein [Nocardia sp. NPDC057227]|uniref:alpha/beta hydrolase family protein n=1 Tax=Nocardia sp. NPDC057227 TaxID=3346056 RepID=UPI0036443E1C